MSLMTEKEKTKRTTVDLTEKARRLFIHYRNSFPARGILSVGVELFDSLSAEQKQLRIGTAIAEDKAARAFARSAAKGALSHAPTQKRTRAEGGEGA